MPGQNALRGWVCTGDKAQRRPGSHACMRNSSPWLHTHLPACLLPQNSCISLNMLADQPPTGMATCAAQGDACSLSVCYPCYCGGLAAVASNFTSDGEWLSAAKTECAAYIDAFDWKSMAIRWVGDEPGELNAGLEIILNTAFTASWCQLSCCQGSHTASTCMDRAVCAVHCCCIHNTGHKRPIRSQ